MSKPLCVMVSPLTTRSGYGDWALAIAKSLNRYDKYDLKLAPTPWGSCSKKTNLDEALGSDLASKILTSSLNKQPDLFIQVTIPVEFSAMGKFNIGMTAGIETTVPKPEWIEGLNRMNFNIVTSNHAKDVFVQAKYKKQLPNGTTEDLIVKPPMEVLFWGANTNIYNNANPPLTSVNEEMDKIPEEFAFLFVGQWTSGNMNSDRKCIGYLIKTFLETFMNIDNPPCLILKTSGAQICVMDRYDCLNKIHEVTNLVKNEHPYSKLPNVYLMYGDLKDEEMNALYNHKKVKVHVSFTHGEGFGHPLLLSTLSGKPLIAPNWSGHLDFLNPLYASFFPGKIEPIPADAINEWFVKDAQWFNVDFTEARKIFKHYFYNYDQQLLDKAEALRKENMEKFSMQAMDTAFHALLNKYVPEFATNETIKFPKLKKINLPTNS